jgi:mRNA-degrading endonuclease YafQ of YafQ-DinJ toxin-antitoxin module
VAFDPYYTEEFRRQVRRYRSFARQIEQKIQLLLKDPYRNCKSERLHGELKGLRSARLTKNIRIIFAICEESGGAEIAGLSGICGQLARQGKNGVVFITLDVHARVYRGRG